MPIVGKSKYNSDDILLDTQAMGSMSGASHLCNEHKYLVEK